MKGSDVIGVGKAVLAGLVLLLIAGAAGFYWIERDAKDDGGTADLSAAVVVKEAEVDGKRYAGYVKGEGYYVEDIQTKQAVRLRAFQGEGKRAMSRQAAKPASAFSRYEENGLIDPASLEVGIVPSIPYTFDSKPEQSFVYLETLLFDGWTIAGYYSDPQYIDYYLRKENVVIRLIVLEDRLKLFYDIDWKIADPKEYVSR